MTTTKPLETIRIGSVQAAIWSNDTKYGPKHNATFERLYRDGDAWKSSSTFGRDDLLLLAKVADRTHTRITELEVAGRLAADDTDPLL